VNVNSFIETNGAFLNSSLSRSILIISSSGYNSSISNSNTDFKIILTFNSVDLCNLLVAPLKNQRLSGCLVSFAIELGRFDMR